MAAGTSAAGAVWCEGSEALVQSVWATRAGVDAALADDLDTPTAIGLLLQQLSHTHGLLDAHEEQAHAAAAAGGAAGAAGAAGAGVGAAVAPLGGLWVSVRYVATVCRLFGLDDAETGAFDCLDNPGITGKDGGAGGGGGGGGSGGGLSGAEFEGMVAEVLRLRSVLRSAAMEKRPLEAGELWSLCDGFRDELMPKMRVAVKDHRDGTTSWERTKD